MGAGGNYWPDGCTNINIVNGQEVEVPKPWVKSESVGQMKYVLKLLFTSINR